MPCYLCKSPRPYMSYFCDGCTKIQKLCDLYGPEIVHQLIENTLKVKVEKIDDKSKKVLEKLKKP